VIETLIDNAQERGRCRFATYHHTNSHCITTSKAIGPRMNTNKTKPSYSCFIRVHSWPPDCSCTCFRSKSPRRRPKRPVPEAIDPRPSVSRAIPGRILTCHRRSTQAVLLIHRRRVDDCRARLSRFYPGALGREPDHTRTRPPPDGSAAVARGEAMIELTRFWRSRATLSICLWPHPRREIYDKLVKSRRPRSPRWGMSGSSHR